MDCPLALITLGFLTLFENAQSQATDQQLYSMQRLKDKLFKTYDKNVRPALHHRNVTTVTLNLQPRYLIGLDEEKSQFSMDVLLNLTWSDERLKWNESEYGGLSLLRIGSNHVWQPDITVYNSFSSDANSKKEVNVLLNSTGKVFWIPPSTVTSICSVEMKVDYPDDIHVCKVIFGSWTHDGWQIDLVTSGSGFGMGYFINSNPRWELLEMATNVTRNVQQYPCCDEPYVTVTAAFTLKRKHPVQLQVTRAPCMLVMFLTLAMFWIPPESGKKITLGALLLLILTNMLIYVADASKSSQTPQFAVSFIRSTMCALTSAILLEILVMNIGRILGPCRPPKSLIQFLSGPIGKFCCIWVPPTPKESGDRVQLTDEGEPLSPKDEWLLVAIGLDRTLFVIYVVALATIHKT